MTSTNNDNHECDLLDDRERPAPRLAEAIFVRRNAWAGTIDRSSGENEVERTTIAFNGSVCGTGITKNVLGPHTASGGNMGDVWKAWGS